MARVSGGDVRGWMDNWNCIFSSDLFDPPISVVVYLASVLFWALKLP